MLILEATLAFKLDSELGEGPVWDTRRKKLFWVDIEKCYVHCLDPATRHHVAWRLWKKVGAVVPTLKEGMLIAMQGELAELDLTTGDARHLAFIEPGIPRNRCNDGKCDPSGRFWVGTMDVDCLPGRGGLYHLDSGMRVTRVLENLTISNGMGWSPADDEMYFIDSGDRNVRSFRFDLRTGALSDPKVIVDLSGEDGVPDGMCTDDDGMLWIGFYGGARVGRYDPFTGNMLASVVVPSPHVTSCCFGGEELGTLYITTARQGLSADQLREFPLSGSLFSAQVGVKGIPCDRFAH